MCGICGFAHANKGLADRRRLLELMTDLLRHRGPDDEGYHVDEMVALGMRRLSIIDLHTGDQPVANEDGSIRLVFNGEIYNFRELRDHLEAKGHRFSSQSDTEVLVHGYEEHGDAVLSLLNGMFAFALWDAREQRLLLARDRLGIKPLYYYAQADQIVFGSELKAVVAYPGVPRELDLIALDQYLTLEYIPAPRTIYHGVSKLRPGHKLVFQEGTARVAPYWQLEKVPLPEDEGELRAHLKELLRDSVRLQMVSDVPLGAFLSGGIDSSTILAFMSELSDEPVRAFSIGFEDATYDELPYARLVANRFGAHHVERVLPSDVHDLAEKLIRHFDEPFADFSIFPTYLVSQLAREHVKVVLSGDGGDEIFGGYETYLAQSLDRYYRLIPHGLRATLLPSMLDQISPGRAKKGLLNRAKRFVEGGSLPSGLQHSRWMMFMSGEDKRSLYHEAFSNHVESEGVADLLRSWFERVAGLPQLSQQQFVDIHTYLPDDILTKVDRMSMAVSLEARVPLLDHRLVEFAWSLPSRHKVHRMKTKVLLRQAMTDILPADVLRKPKEGFSIPIKHWLRGPLRPLMQDLLSSSKLREGGLFREECVQGWIGEHLAGKANHSHRLWALIAFQLWRENVDVQEPALV